MSHLSSCNCYEEPGFFKIINETLQCLERILFKTLLQRLSLQRLRGAPSRHRVCVWVGGRVSFLSSQWGRGALLWLPLPPPLPVPRLLSSFLPVDWCHLACSERLPVCSECEHIPQNADRPVSHRCQDDLLNPAPPDTPRPMCFCPNSK